MSNNKISYINKNFDDYKESLKEYIKQYYPQISNDLDDASIGSWLIDLVAAVSDNLSYHIDKTYTETNIDTAQQSNSIYNIARSNGFKVPGPKGSMAQVTFSCVVPIQSGVKNSNSTLTMPAESLMPVIKRGTKVSSSSQVFEVMDDIDFSSPFDNNGNINREIYPQYDSNGSIKNYKITKKEVVVAGESKTYRQVINSSDITPFMEVIIPEKNVMNVESIIFKVGSDYGADPTMNEFMSNKEYFISKESEVYRFFEVNSLIEQYRWGDEINNNVEGNQSVPPTKIYGYTYVDSENNTITVPAYSVTKGQWIPLTQKFITEFTDKGYLRVIFGSGEQVGQTVDYSEATDFSQYQISKMIRNNFLGKLPQQGWTMYILYRVGGGSASNVAKGAINNITYLNATIGKFNTSEICSNLKTIAEVKDSITVYNDTPSVSGKDAPTVEELKMMIKYNNASQERCVTLKDYENRILMMPPKYGSPFRVSATEENNKVMIYLLGIDTDRKLSDMIPSQMITNITNYLSMYRTINDFVEIKSGRIVNISVEIDLLIDKNYNTEDVINNAINTIKDFMDINNHYLGESIFIGELEKKINDIDGVLNLIDLRIYNEYGKEYSQTISSQVLKSVTNNDITLENDRSEIDLEACDYTLNSDADSMYEIKYPNKDIIVKVKSR